MSSNAHCQPRTVKFEHRPSLIDALWAPEESLYEGIFDLAISLFNLKRLTEPIQLAEMLKRTGQPVGIGPSMQLFAFGNGEQFVSAFRNMDTNEILPRLSPASLSTRQGKPDLIPEETEIVFSRSSPGCLRCVLSVSSCVEQFAEAFALSWWTPKSTDGEHIEIETGSSRFFTEREGRGTNDVLLGLLPPSTGKPRRQFYAHMKAKSNFALAILVKIA